MNSNVIDLWTRQAIEPDSAFWPAANLVRVGDRLSQVAEGAHRVASTETPATSHAGEEGRSQAATMSDRAALAASNERSVGEDSPDFQRGQFDGFSPARRSTAAGVTPALSQAVSKSEMADDMRQG